MPRLKGSADCHCSNDKFRNGWENTFRKRCKCPECNTALLYSIVSKTMECPNEGCGRTIFTQKEVSLLEPVK